MLTPEQLATGDARRGFDIPVENLRIGTSDLGPVALTAQYDARWRLRLDLSKYVSEQLAAHTAFSGEEKASFRYREGQKDTPLLITKVQFSFDSEETHVTVQPQRQPVILQSEKEAQSLKGILISSPELIPKPILLRDHVGTNVKITRQGAKESGLCLLEADCADSAEQVLTKLEDLTYFLTFVKGTNWGIGHIFGYDAASSISYRLLGFTRNDAGKRQNNWFDIDIQNTLPEIFAAFSTAMQDDIARIALRQSIEFYRASNASRDVSLEMAIIAAHSALEAIVNYALEHRAGWSTKLARDRRIRFSDKMRAAMCYFGFKGDALEHSPELSSLTGPQDVSDAYEKISYIRNKLVHQDTNARPTGLQLHETWLLAQWSVEILIFGVIGYRGRIIDRRRYIGWRGSTCEIPLEPLSR